MIEPAPTSEPFPHRTSRLPIVVLIGLTIVALTAAFWLWSNPLGRSPATTPTVSLPLAATGTAPARPLVATGVFVEPGDGRVPLLDEIATARRSIDLEVYIVTDEPILRALEAAHRRDVAVRVILEQHPFGGDGRQPEIFARLEQAGIAVRWGNPVFRFTHMEKTGTRRAGCPAPDRRRCADHAGGGLD